MEVPIPVGAQSDWITALGHRPYPVKPFDIASALKKSSVSVTTMERPLESDLLACSYLGASISWLLDPDK